MSNNFYINNILPDTINFNGKAVKSVYFNNNFVWGEEVIDEIPGALLFVSKTSFYISPGIYWDGVLESSANNGATWNEVTSSGRIQAGLVNGKWMLCFRGTENTRLTALEHWYYGGESNVACIGNIETLLDYQTVLAGEHPPMGFLCFGYIFKDWVKLTKAPRLPAITLTQSCYSNMFSGCTSLIEAPELPATTLASGCYGSMFYGCTSLTKAPELPATTLAEYCYNYMFYGCTSLIEAPKLLPATTLASGCYSYMFSGCSSLIEAPELPATTLADDCYSGMFEECTSLTKAPELPATTLAYQCYSTMFYGCTSLTKVSKLPATTLAISCYAAMYRGCMNLFEIPELPATILANSCYFNMFDYCPITISESRTDDCVNEFRIPSKGTIENINDYDSFTFMVFGFSLEPNKTYYIDATII